MLHQRTRRRRVHRMISAGVRTATPLPAALAVALTVALPASGLAAVSPSRTSPAVPVAARADRSVQEALDGLVRAGSPGALAQVRSDAHLQNFASGYANLRTRQRPTPWTRFRVGSITKTFVATTILQLVAEGRLSLSDTVERLLPGVITGNGNNGAAITVRMLLNHTSGLFSYTDDTTFQRLFARDPLLYFTADDLVHIALGHPPVFPPGTGWSYSNTNYIVLGMIIDRITGHTYEQEITRRIIQPLHLRSSYLPGHDPGVRPPRMTGYTGDLLPPGRVQEINRFDNYGADGELISTAGDLNRFLSALLGGRLLPDRLLRQMIAPTVVNGRPVAYGLGVISQKLTCGVTVYGHDGVVLGSKSTVYGVLGGRRSIATNMNADYLDVTTTSSLLTSAYEDVFCRTPDRAAPGTARKATGADTRRRPAGRERAARAAAGDRA